MPSLFDIEIRNETKIKLPLRTVRLKVRRILQEIGLKKAGISLLFVDDKNIRKINKKYLGHDWATDVIAFGKSVPFKALEDPDYLGDIVISVETTQKQAKAYGNTFSYELFFYICHGILHLRGFKDKTQAQREHMHKKQAQILKAAGITNGHS